MRMTREREDRERERARERIYCALSLPHAIATISLLSSHCTYPISPSSCGNPAGYKSVSLVPSFLDLSVSLFLSPSIKAQMFNFLCSPLSIFVGARLVVSRSGMIIL